MNLSDRYSCEEHGKDRHEGCIACEVYSDIAELEAALKSCNEGQDFLNHVIEEKDEIIVSLRKELEDKT